MVAVLRALLMSMSAFVDFSARTTLALPRAAVARSAEVLRQFDRVTWGGIPIVAVAGLSGMSKGEVERIWLPFAMWVLPAAAVLGLGARRSQWLALQVVFTIGLQTLVRSPW